MLNPRFCAYGVSDVQDLIAQYPLAWVMAPGAPIAHASPLPLLGRYDEKGHLIALVGHMARRNPLHRELSAAPSAHILFTGPQGYISPAHSGRRDWGPTWNYAVLRIDAQVRFDASATGQAIEELLKESEVGQAAPWHSCELGARYEGMLGAIIAFEAQVTALDATFKLAQDEDDAVLHAIVDAHPDAAMRQWIRKLNAERL